MATINATININSDILNNPITISNTMTMTKAGVTTGIENTNGLGVKNLQATTAVVLELAADATASKASKVYIRNTGSNKAEHVKISLNASASADDTTEAIGRLYGGDWMFIPANFHDANADVEITATGGTNIICYALFHEGTTLVAS